MLQRVAVLGEVLWDVFPSGARIGGAAFNFSVQSRRLGECPLLVTAVGEDELGQRTLGAMDDFGLDTRMVKELPGVATGTVTVELNPDGQPRYTLHRPAPWDSIGLSEVDLANLAAFQPSWIYFGTLQNLYETSRNSNLRALEAVPRATRVYDLNLRKDSFTPELVHELLTRSDIVKLNDDEIAWVSDTFGIDSGRMEDFARRLCDRYGCHTVIMTLGDRGAALVSDGEYTRAKGYRVKVADTVGAGDSFTAAVVHGLAQGWPTLRILDFANRLGACVASRPGGTPAWELSELERMERE